MCDDQTEAENEIYLRNLQLRRRALSLGAGATAATMQLGCGPDKTSPPPASTTPETTPAPGAATPTPPADEGAVETKGRMVTVETPDGRAERYFVTPASGKHPAVIMWPDIAGLRQAFETMAKRLAGSGYAVLAVNCYYRSSKMPVLDNFDAWRTDEGRAKIAPMREALTAEAVAKDGAAFVKWLDQQPEDPEHNRFAILGSSCAARARRSEGA
jgi:carboxymethylenebutenolidase